MITRRQASLLIPAVTLLAGRAAAQSPPSAAMQAVLDYAESQKTTGLVIVRGGRTLVERNWPVAAGAERFLATMVHGKAADGSLLEDVASQQKSFVSVLVQIAVDKGLIDVARPVSAYIGPGWSKATPEQEAAIRLIDVLHQSSGLTERFTYEAAPNTVFYYNTPVYAVTKRVVAAAAKQPLDRITHDWLTAPLGMKDTAWRQRPGAMGDVGNPTGLVTTPADVARFGAFILAGGRGPDGRRLVSEASFRAMFERAPTNPAYGRLWWLNGSAFSIMPLKRRKDGPLIPAAPPDLVAALGALDRKLYVVPSLKTVVVRMGEATPDRDFDQQLWLRLMKALA